MNGEVLNNYIDAYKINFDRISHQEIYKWKAVKCFQDNWDIEAESFYDMLVSSIRLTENLLKSGQYFPLRMLKHYAEKRPEATRALFRDLYNEDLDLYDRINNFQQNIEGINSALFPDKQTYQDHRAILVYLTLRFPESHFLYKFKMFESFSEKLRLIYKPIVGRIENIGHFYSQCELIRHRLSQDQELLKLHKDRVTPDCYYDESLNILTQDFIYAVAKHLTTTSIVTEPIPAETVIEMLHSSQVNNTNGEISFRGRTVNFIQNSIENKRIGDLGEFWVMKYEAEKLKRANKHGLIKDIKHTAKDEGDGTGFDILSFDDNGERIFIEVKTTKGSKNSTFFITRNELERSKQESNRYYLYRLYNYNEQNDTGDLLIIHGALDSMCEFPEVYKVNITDI